jgi:hypothetical protein
MAFGINRKELKKWQSNVLNGNIDFLTHYWLDERFPGCTTVTKVGCSDVEKLADWGRKYGLERRWIHRDEQYPHFDLFGDKQREVLKSEQKWDQIQKFSL